LALAVGKPDTYRITCHEKSLLLTTSFSFLAGLLPTLVEEHLIRQVYSYHSISFDLMELDGFGT
jgi:hypothetical protein